MATQNLSAQAAESNTPTYQTRYGVTTASDAALDLLDRARFRAAFLSTMFNACIERGITIPDYETGGLAYLLEDISYDIQTAYDYYFGDDDAPGKLHGAPEVRS